MGGLLHLVAALVISAGLTGCTLLDLLLGVPPFPDPDATFPLPSSATAMNMTTGTATMKLAGETIVLDELVGTGLVEPGFGTHVTWTDGAGWYLSLIEYDDAGMPDAIGYVSIDRVRNGQHWVAYDSFRCVLKNDHTSFGVAGSAVCRDVEWIDYFKQFASAGEPEGIEGEPRFDADITFEAH